MRKCYKEYCNHFYNPSTERGLKNYGKHNPQFDGQWWANIWWTKPKYFKPDIWDSGGFFTLACDPLSILYQHRFGYGSATFSSTTWGDLAEMHFSGELTLAHEQNYMRQIDVSAVGSCSSAVEPMHRCSSSNSSDIKWSKANGIH